MNYIKPFDGLRAIAVLLVMAFHFNLVGSGWIGVPLFFVLSGFLITRILINMRDLDIKLFDKLKIFYIKRSLRIFPPYFLYLFIFIGVFAVIGFPDEFGTRLKYLFTYTYNYTPLFEDFENISFFTHFWSLSVEEQFYIFWPLIILVIPKNRMKLLFYVFIIAAPIIRFAAGILLENYTDLNSFDRSDSIYWMTISHVDAFALGGFFTLLTEIKKVVLKRMLIISTSLFVVYAGINHYFLFDTITLKSILGVYPLPAFVDTGFPTIYHVFTYSISNFFFASVILFFVKYPDDTRTWVHRILCSKPFVAIGKVSYGMYLYHWAVMVAYQRVALTGILILDFILYSIVVYIVSYLSFRIIESWFIKQKDNRYIRKLIHG